MNIMQLIKTTFCVGLLRLALAATCNTSNALPYQVPDSASSSRGSSSTSGSGSSLSSPTAKSAEAANRAFATCVNECTTMLSCYTACLDTLCTGLCDLKTNPPPNCHSECVVDICAATDGVEPDAGDLQTCYELRGEWSSKTENAVLDLIDKKAKRTIMSVLSCSAGQTCYAEKNGDLFCLNTSTGDYIDIKGGNGNVKTGSYTSAEASTPTSTSTKASSTLGSGIAVAVAAVTSTDKNIGAKGLKVDAFKGLIGLLMGLML